MEQAANKIIRHLYDQMTDQVAGGRSFALVRFYKTHPYGYLGEGLREFARGILGSAPESEEMNCLTMFATAGDKLEWNSRGNSSGHRAIPLASTDMVAQIPMTWQLLSQFGVNVNSVLKTDPALIAEMESKSYGTFHVAEAAGSPYIPAQDDFVLPNGIKSVLDFGGVLGPGHLSPPSCFQRPPLPSTLRGCSIPCRRTLNKRYYRTKAVYSPVEVGEVNPRAKGNYRSRLALSFLGVEDRRYSINF